MITLRPYQETALNEIMNALVEKQNVLLQASTGAGKCLAPGTPVLLYDGTIKAVENVAAGDNLMGPDSRPRTVTSLAAGTEQMYKIVPVKGGPFTVNESHILSLVITGGTHGVNGPDGRMYQPGDIVSVSVADYLTSSKTFKHMAKGYRSDQVEFAPNNDSLPIPPYILGVWLGDGNSRNSEICNVDQEVIDEWHKYAESIGHQCKTLSVPGKAPIYRIKAPAVGLMSRGHKSNFMRAALKNLNLLCNKHIPQTYKTSSVKNRLELLAGIIDTDGFLSSGNYDLCLKHLALAEAVVFVARSLGLAAYIKSVKKTCVNNGAVGSYWRITISGHTDIIPCRVARRKAGPRSQKKNVLNFGFSVEPAGEGRYHGFELEGPDRRFLLGDFTITHNTVIFSEIIKRWMTAYPKMSIAVIAHRQELVSQAADKLFQVWPEGRNHVGVACASLGRVKTNRPVIIGSVQTLSASRRLARLADPVHMLIIDEAHHIPPIETGGQYHTLISHLREINPRMRVLGVTATPFRLNHGYIYGSECRKGCSNLFDALDHKIGLDDLTAAGYLAPRQEMEKSIGADLKSVRTSKGEYDSSDLNSLMIRSVYIQGAVEAYRKYGQDRNKVLVFAVSIEHAKLLAEEFSRSGYEACAVHSLMNKSARRSVLNRFDNGTLRILINVEILTEGWDSPRINAVLMCRPTQSPGLFVQMIGRGTRLAPDKKDLLVLDLVENYLRHGDPDNPIVEVPAVRAAKTKNKKTKRVCPLCGAMVPYTQPECPECHWSFGQGELMDTSEGDVVMAKVAGGSKDGQSRVLKWDAEGKVSFSGNYMLVLEAQCRPGGLVKHWMDIEGAASDYGRTKAQKLWYSLSGGQRPPATVREAEMRTSELKMPKRITLVRKNGYKNIKEFS